MRDRNSMAFANMHTSAFYEDSTKKKIDRDKFKENSYYAHLIGRAYACEVILNKHKAEPYESVDVLLGDIHIEMTNALNHFRAKTMFHRCDKFQVEHFID